MLRFRSLVFPLSICLALLGGSASGAARAQTCAASSGWFTNPSFPAEIPGGADANNCQFQQFAWQAFGAATQPEGGSSLLYDTWMPDYGIFVTSGSPVPWGQSPPTPCKNDAANATGRVFRVRTAKSASTAVNANGDEQAFGGKLYDQNNAVVWYEAFVNRAEYDFITGCQFYNTGCIQAAPSTTALPAGSIEVKTAWRQWTASTPPPSNFYSVKGMIDSPTCTPATFLLVGYHLVINTPLHPELIWATFEHVDNDPDCTNPKPAPAGGWSFNNPSCIQGAKPCPTNVQDTNPTQVCRVDPQGGGSTENVGNIRAINRSVDGVLASLVASDPAKFGYLAVWRNYEMTGNLWTEDGKLPPSTANYRGSIYAANTVLETYAQHTTRFQNCFSCHTNVSRSAKPTTFKGNAPANLSHLFKEAAEAGGCNNGAGPLPTTCTAKATSAAQRKAALLEPYPSTPGILPAHTPAKKK